VGVEWSGDEIRLVVVVVVVGVNNSFRNVQVQEEVFKKNCSARKGPLLLFLFFICGTGNQTWGLAHVRHVMLKFYYIFELACTNNMRRFYCGNSIHAYSVF
jgi:hypothetical protein